MSVRGNKLGEIEFKDYHTILLFSKDDRKYMQETYIDKLVSYNCMIDEVFEELIYQRKEINKMVYYSGLTKMIRAFRYKNKYISAKFYNSCMRLEDEYEKLLGERRQIMQDFHEKAIRSRDDQTISDKRFEPIDAASPEDLVTATGVNKVNQQITSETFKKWDFFGLGRSLNPVYFDQGDLIDPISRFYIKSHGSFAAIGDVIRLLVISPSDMPTDDIGEVCVANAQAGGDILFRTVLEKQVHHDTENNFLCSSSNVYTVSRR